MSPGAEPVIALTLPIGLRCTRRAIANVASSQGCLQLKRRASARPRKLKRRASRDRERPPAVGANGVQSADGGADRDRTGGLLVANQALSQLSYSPEGEWWA
jgi:hypothetical protein